MASKIGVIESQKTRLEIRTDDDPVTWAAVIELTDAPIPTASRSSADVTTLDDSFKRRDSSGVIDFGSAEYKGLALSGNTTHELIRNAFITGDFIKVRVVTPDNTAYTFDALVTKWGKEVKSGDKLRMSFTLDIDGEVVESVLP